MADILRQMEKNRGKVMEASELNDILNGPLSHPLIPMQINRFALALASVVYGGGIAAADALRIHAGERQRRDEQSPEATMSDIGGLK